MSLAPEPMGLVDRGEGNQGGALQDCSKGAEGAARCTARNALPVVVLASRVPAVANGGCGLLTIMVGVVEDDL
eukprot:Skav228129  [mRNA]  locus=scaffold1220:344951:345169:+ [translate_table: standard]